MVVATNNVVVITHVATMVVGHVEVILVVVFVVVFSLDVVVFSSVVVLVVTVVVLVAIKVAFSRDRCSLEMDVVETTVELILAMSVNMATTSIVDLRPWYLVLPKAKM